MHAMIRGCLLLPLYLFNIALGLIFNVFKLQNTSSISTMKKSLLDIYTYIDAFWPNTIVKGNGLMVLSCSVMWETRSIICLKLAAAAGWLQQPGRQTVVFPPLLEWRWRADRADWARHRHLHFSKLSPQNPGFFLEVLQSGYRYTNTTIHTSLTVSYETDLDIYLSTRCWKTSILNLEKIKKQTYKKFIYIYLSNNILETWSCVLI